VIVHPVDFVDPRYRRHFGVNGPAFRRGKGRPSDKVIHIGSLFPGGNSVVHGISIYYFAGFVSPPVKIDFNRIILYTFIQGKGIKFHTKDKNGKKALTGLFDNPVGYLTNPAISRREPLVFGP
jgi:hypothetical protein